MTLTFPWSGRDIQGQVPMSGRAAVPVPSGAGFNWPGVVRYTSGRLRGLGQDTSTTTINLPGFQTLPTFDPTASGGQTSPLPSSSQAPWYAPLIAAGLATGQTIANYQLNPLLQKQTYVTTPQGLVYASNVPTSGIPGLTTATAGSLMPLLLIGGVGLMLIMMMSRR